nr:hypothetical protein Iba_chr04cCG0330 [Ipomoea batatas]
MVDRMMNISASRQETILFKETFQECIKKPGLGDAALNALEVLRLHDPDKAVAVEEDALRPGQRGGDFAGVGVVAEVQYGSWVVREDQGGLVVVDAVEEIVPLEQNECVRRAEDARGPTSGSRKSTRNGAKPAYDTAAPPRARSRSNPNGATAPATSPGTRRKIKGVKIRQSENRRRNRSLQAVIRQAETLAF